MSDGDVPSCDSPGCYQRAFRYYIGTNKKGDRQRYFVCKLCEQDIDGRTHDL